jgi:predicted phage terminase large subunit-like protein
MIKRAWLRNVPTMPQRNEYSLVLASWDVATKTNGGADYSVGTVWGVHEQRYYLLDLVRGRWEFPDLVRQVEKQAGKWRPSIVVIEDANTGSALIQNLQRKPSYSVVGVQPRLSKEVRAAQQLPLFESGRVLFPPQAPWLEELVTELCAFPNGRHDDQVDSVIQALQELVKRSDEWDGALIMPTGLERPSLWGEIQRGRFENW